MASGRQMSDQNIETFAAWAASKNDHDFREMVSRGALVRKEIAKECNFARSVLDQNPRVKTALQDLESRLRGRGVLPEMVEAVANSAVVPPMRETGRLKAQLEWDRTRRLEQENAALRAENSELKRQIEKYTVLSEALSLTGRVPR